MSDSEKKNKVYIPPPSEVFEQQVAPPLTEGGGEEKTTETTNLETTKKQLQGYLEALYRDGLIRYVPCTAEEVRTIVNQINDGLSGETFKEITGRLVPLIKDLEEGRKTIGQVIYELEYRHPPQWPEAQRLLAVYLLGAHVAYATMYAISDMLLKNSLQVLPSESYQNVANLQRSSLKEDLQSLPEPSKPSEPSEPSEPASEGDAEKTGDLKTIDKGGRRRKKKK